MRINLIIILIEIYKKVGITSWVLKQNTKFPLQSFHKVSLKPKLNGKISHSQMVKFPLYIFQKKIGRLF